MGGSFGGMMMRHAMALNGSNSYGCRERRREKTESEKVLEETENTLDYIKERREDLREDHIDVFREALYENKDELHAAGLLKQGDTLYKILCRAAGVKYCKPKRRKTT